MEVQFVYYFSQLWYKKCFFHLYKTLASDATFYKLDKKFSYICQFIVFLKLAVEFTTNNQYHVKPTWCWNAVNCCYCAGWPWDWPRWRGPTSQMNELAFTFAHQLPFLEERMYQAKIGSCFQD